MAATDAYVFLYGAIILLTGAGWMERKRLYDRDNAVVVEGTVQYAGVDKQFHHIGTPFTHYPKIVYTYSHGGESYTSDSVYPGWQVGRSKSAAKTVAADYTPGETITVYVNERDPSRAYLQETSGAYVPRTLAIFCVGVAFLLAGVSML